jgi:hypothetical protein
MATKKAYRGVPLNQFRKFVSIVGYDGAYMAVRAIEEGKGTQDVMRELQPYLERRFAARRTIKRRKGGAL